MFVDLWSTRHLVVFALIDLVSELLYFEFLVAEKLLLVFDKLFQRSLLLIIFKQFGFECEIDALFAFADALFAFADALFAFADIGDALFGMHEGLLEYNWTFLGLDEGVDDGWFIAEWISGEFGATWFVIMHWF